jgi:hypothetical protein
MSQFTICLEHVSDVTSAVGEGIGNEGGPNRQDAKNYTQ